MSITKRLSSWRKRKGCHDNKSENDATQHIGSGSSWRCRWKRKSDVSELSKMVGCSRLPGSHMSVTRQKRGNVNRQFWTRGEQGCISYITQHAFVSRVIVSAVIPSKRANKDDSGSVQNRGRRHSRDNGNGSSCSRFIVVQGHRWYSAQQRVVVLVFENELDESEVFGRHGTWGLRTCRTRFF